MYHISKAADPNKWYEYLRDFYQSDLFIGRINDELYMKKLNDSFDISELSIDELKNTNLRLFSSLSRLSSRIDHIWLLEDNTKSSFFYNYQKRHSHGLPILIVWPDSENQFRSNDSMFDSFLCYYRGIDKDSLNALDAKAKAYLNSINTLAQLTVTAIGPDKPVLMVINEPSHNKYFH